MTLPKKKETATVEFVLKGSNPVSCRIKLGRRPFSGQGGEEQRQQKIKIPEEKSVSPRTGEGDILNVAVGCLTILKKRRRMDADSAP